MVLLLQVVADIVNTYYAHSESSENTRLREKDVVSGSPDDSAQGRGVDVSRLEAFVMESEPLKELKRKLEFLGTTPIWRDHSSRSVFWRAVTCIQNAADRWRRRQSAGISPDSTAGQIQWRCPACGRVVLDEYIENSPDALSRLEELLGGYSTLRWEQRAHSAPARQPGNPQTREGNGPSGFRRWISSWANPPQHNLPRQREDAGSSNGDEDP
ncbi:hypothetical protein CGRA01v4_08971 [Colletotrichum graminicola]|nr:hypothetical protein CGRA01v4_08971 [Colletotrichum graminicola]